MNIRFVTSALLIMCNCAPQTATFQSDHLQGAGLVLNNSATANKTVIAETVNSLNITVTTAIDPPSPQSGMKSRHTVVIDTDNLRLLDSPGDNYFTGSTRIGPIRVGSVRDDFNQREVTRSSNAVTLRIDGTTASGIGVLPDIDYDFEITIFADGNYAISGSHDGYPSYSVEISGIDAPIYQYIHPQVGLDDAARLLSGDGDDVPVPKKIGPYRQAKPDSTRARDVPAGAGDDPGAGLGRDASSSRREDGWIGGSGGGGGCLSTIFDGTTLTCYLK